MPTYQYSCTECGHFFEIVQSFSDDSLTVCPECEGRLRKVFNAVGVVFKGSGFYRTDSRNGSGASSGEDSGSSKKESAESSTSSPATGSSGDSSSSTSSSSSESKTSAKKPVDKASSSS